MVLDGKSSQEYPGNAGVLQVSHFSYTLMIFLMMLSVILLSMVMILLSILSVMGRLIFGNNWLRKFGALIRSMKFLSPNVVYGNSRKVKQQFTHRRMWFYLANFEQNILFGPFQLYELSSYCEIENWKTYC